METPHSKTVKEALEIFGISRKTLYSRIKEGEVESYLEDGRRYVIIPEETMVNSQGKQVNSEVNNKETGGKQQSKQVNTEGNTQETPSQEGVSTEKNSDDDPTSNDAELIAHMREEIQFLRGQVDSWRLQTEASNRALSEVSAALRKALELNQRQLLPPMIEEKPTTGPQEEKPVLDIQKEESAPKGQPSERQPEIEEKTEPSEFPHVEDQLVEEKTETEKSTFFGRLFRRFRS